MPVATPVVLVNMPLTAVERPSLALGLLKALLTRDGLQSRVIHSNMWFLEYVGIADYHVLESALPEEGVVDWLFGAVAFPDFRPDADLFLNEYFRRNPMYSDRADELRATFKKLRARMIEFVDWTIDKILVHRPRVVGCSSTFSQHVPSLALLRRLRERAPHVVTMMGGANCETVMGRATHARFPWVDYVVSGEADGLVTTLVRDILARGRDIPLDALPFGVFGPPHRAAGYPSTTTGDFVPRAVMEDMRDLPLPDFSDYFAELRESLFADRIWPGLPMEFSRGCWWGERSHCTFCGLNGGQMSFRQKPAEKAAGEMIEMSRRYGSRRIEAVDNILALDYVDKTLPELAAMTDKLNVFFEVKANLKRHEVEKLAAAGVRWIQPGIESLDTRVLKLMGKGVTAAHNVQLLKWCRQNGVRVSWSVLWGFPGESDEWYAEMAPWLGHLHHLQPGRAVRLRYQRYSPYHQNPQKYGLKLRAAQPYRYVYPLSESELDDQVYYFEDSPQTDAGGHLAGRDPTRRPGLHAVAKGLDGWLKAWYAPHLPMLSMRHAGSSLLVNDTRALAIAPHHQLAGAHREVMLAADEGMPEARICASISKAGFGAKEIDTAIGDLLDAKLLLRMDQRLVGLALWYPHVPMPAPTAFPGGYFDRRNEPLLAAA
ncbi:MAG: RiPP maturation radical SAM C-methyltransferase [Enhydrobacter sp.]|nr:MAG: RiPP maturation radical SAM C-methyltransferase [Enhydrobacter sp.]